MIMTTRCWKCGEVLSDKTGKRVKDAIFDSRVKKPEGFCHDENTIWALCEACHKRALGKKKR